VLGADVEELVAQCKSRGMGVLAADGYGKLNLDRLQDESAARRLGGAGTSSDYALEAPTAWLFGNEAQGLSEAELALADHRVAVPVYGSAESLNLGTAATVCLYASARSQQA
jgi:TrmH family RNA methyltransferase